MDGLASKTDKEASRQTDRFASILLIALSCLRNQARTQTQQRSLKIEEIAVMVEFSTTVGEDKCYVRYYHCPNQSMSTVTKPAVDRTEVSITTGQRQSTEFAVDLQFDLNYGVILYFLRE